MNFKNIFLNPYLLLIVFIAFSSVGATWVREKGRSLFYGDLSYRSTNEYYINGEAREANSFQELNFSVYLDYGVTETYTIGVYAPLVKALSIDSTPVSPNVLHVNRGDIDFIQRYQFASFFGAVFNLELLLGIPTGNHQERHGLHTGDGEFNIMPGLSMGWGFSFFSLPSYLTLYTGMNYRNNGFSNEVHSSFQWGSFVYKEKLLLSFEAKKLESLENEEQNFTDEGLWNNTSYLSYGLGITYKFDRDSGIAFYYKTLSEVDNALGGNIYSVGAFQIY